MQVALRADRAGFPASENQPASAAMTSPAQWCPSQHVLDQGRPGRPHLRLHSCRWSRPTSMRLAGPGISAPGQVVARTTRIASMIGWSSSTTPHSRCAWCASTARAPRAFLRSLMLTRRVVSFRQVRGVVFGMVRGALERPLWRAVRVLAHTFSTQRLTPASAAPW